VRAEGVAGKGSFERCNSRRIRTTFAGCQVVGEGGNAKEVLPTWTKDPHRECVSMTYEGKGGGSVTSAKIST